MNRMFGLGIGVSNQPQGLDVGIPSGGGSNIKSIQSGIINFSAETTLTAVLTSVDTTKSIVILNYSNAVTAAALNTQTIGTITNSTTLTVQRQGSTNAQLSVSWTVVEFVNVKSVQKGSLSLPSGTATVTATLSSINTSKSIAFASFTSDDTAGDISSLAFQYYISNNTTLTFKHRTAYGTKTVQWYVVEFN